MEKFNPSAGRPEPASKKPVSGNRQHVSLMAGSGQPVPATRNQRPASARGLLPSGWVFMFLFFSFFFLLPAAHAALYDASLSCWSETVHMAGDFRSPLVMAILVMGLIFGLAYMLSSAFERPEWAMWAKSEAATLLFSVLLIFIVVGAFGASCTLSNLMLFKDSRGFASGTGLSGFDASISPANRAIYYLDRLMQNYGLSTATNLVRSSVNDQFAGTAYAYWSVPVLDGGGMAFKANRRAWSAHKDMLADLYMPFLISIKVQQMLLGMLMSGVLAILLPAALLLRTFFASRDIGNLLIALSFSIFFALPLVYCFSLEATGAMESLFGGVRGNPFGNLSIARDTIVGDSFQRIGFLAAQAVVIPNLALIVTVTMTMALNKALRGFVA